MMPTAGEMGIPLLKCLDSMGGNGKPQEIYDKLAGFFPQLNEAERAESQPSGWGNKWNNRVRWVRQNLVAKGEIESPEYGIWAITSKGKQRITDEANSPEAQLTVPEEIKPVDV